MPFDDVATAGSAASASSDEMRTAAGGCRDSALRAQPDPQITQITPIKIQISEHALGPSVLPETVSVLLFLVMNLRNLRNLWITPKNSIANQTGVGVDRRRQSVVRNWQGASCQSQKHYWAIAGWRDSER